MKEKRGLVGGGNNVFSYRCELSNPSHEHQKKKEKEPSLSCYSFMRPTNVHGVGVRSPQCYLPPPPAAA